MLDRLRAMFWTLFSTFSVMMGLALSYVTISTLVKHFAIPWYLVWILVILGFVAYHSIHIFQIPANQMCVFTRFGKEIETIAADKQPQGYRWRVGLLMTRLMLVEEVRVRVMNIDAITNNFVGVRVSAVVVLKRTKGVPVPLDEIYDVVSTQLRIAFLTHVQTWVWTQNTRFRFKASVLVPSIKEALAKINLEVKSIDLDDIAIQNNASSIPRTRPLQTEEESLLHYQQTTTTTPNNIQSSTLHQRNVSSSSSSSSASLSGPTKT